MRALYSYHVMSTKGTFTPISKAESVREGAIMADSEGESKNMSFEIRFQDEELQEIVNTGFNDSVDEEILILTLESVENDMEKEENNSEIDIEMADVAKLLAQVSEKESRADVDMDVEVPEPLSDDDGRNLGVAEDRAVLPDAIENNEAGGLYDPESARERLKDYIKDGKNKNTTRKTDQDIKKFLTYMKEQGCDSELLDIPPNQLDHFIASYLLSRKKSDGSEYEPDTITSIHRSIDRHLRDISYPENIVNSDLFEISRDVLSAKRKELKAKGLGNKPNAAEPLTSSHMNIFWEQNLISVDSAEALQKGLYIYMAECFGFRGRHEGRQLCWGDISSKTDENMDRYLEFNERMTKTRTGESGSGGSRKFSPKMFENKVTPERCPIKMYDIFEEKRPENMKCKESPFFLAVNKNKNATSWYKCQPLGEHSLQKIVSSLAKKAGIPGKLTNHSIRKKTCTELLHNYVNPTIICQLTGHKNVASIMNYAVASHDMQKTMCNMLLNDNKKRNGSPCLEDEPLPKLALCNVEENLDRSVVVRDEVESDPIACTQGNMISARSSKSSSFLGGSVFHGAVTINVTNNYNSHPEMIPSQMAHSHAPGYVYGGVTVGPPARNGFWAKMAAALGVTQLIIGTSCIVFHVVAFFMDKTSQKPIHYLGEGILTGSVIIIAGIFGIASSKKKNNCTIITFLVMSVLSGLFSLFPMVFGIMGATMMFGESLMMPICQLVLATVEIIVATWSIGVSSQAMCCPNSAIAQSASRMMGGAGITQFVANGDGQHVVIFGGGANHPAVMYAAGDPNMPYMLQQGIPSLAMGNPGMPCHINSPSHAGAASRPAPAVEPSHATHEEEPGAVQGQTNKPKSPRSQNAKEKAMEDEKQKLLHEDEKEASPPEVVVTVATPAEAPIDGGFEVEDEKALLLGD